MWIIFWQTMWLMLPAGIANMAPVLFKWVPFLKYPIDFGATLQGRPLLGCNKTYRGLFFGILSAILFVYIETLFYPVLKMYAPADYSKINVFWLGFLLGFGALFGDLVKSFFKRRINVDPGCTWPPFDQIDWIVGALLFSGFYLKLNWHIWVVALVVFGLLHPVVNLIGYYLKIKKNKF